MESFMGKTRIELSGEGEKCSGIGHNQLQINIPAAITVLRAVLPKEFVHDCECIYLI